MSKSKKMRREVSAEARERMRASALARADAEAIRLCEKVRDAMKMIAKEISANGGVYPQNKGAVPLAEVARRAGIHPQTFHKPRYLDLSDEVVNWIQSLKHDATTGRTRSRKSLQTRLDEWKKLHADLLDSHRLSETDLLVAQDRIVDLEAENMQLREQLQARHPKVLPIRALE